MARHTFATTVALSNDVPMESVQSMLGHSDIKTTQLYAHVVDTKLSRDMNNMAKLVNGRNPKVNIDPQPEAVFEAESAANESILPDVSPQPKRRSLIVDESFLISKKGNLKELSERDFFISVVERNFKILYTSSTIKFATNGNELIIGSKFFGEILGGYYSLGNHAGVFEDFHYGIMAVEDLKPIVRNAQAHQYGKAALV